MGIGEVACNYSAICKKNNKISVVIDSDTIIFSLNVNCLFLTFISINIFFVVIQYKKVVKHWEFFVKITK